MKDRFEEFIKLIFDTEEISPQDCLSKEIRAYGLELSEDDLEYVSAAGSGFKNFTGYINSKQK